MNIRVSFSVLAVWLSGSGNIIAQTPCVDGMAGLYPCKNVDLLSVVSNSTMSVANTNDVWGWASPVTGKEYALVGCSNGTAFIDVSDPVNPVYLGKLPTHTGNSLWRDVEVYKDHCFVGSEAGGHGLQIMSLLQLDNVTSPPVTFTETAYYAGFGNSHTINIDPESGWLMAMGSNTFGGGPHLVDINDPSAPQLIGGYSGSGYTHDGFLLTYQGPDQDHQGKVVAMICNENKLVAVDCTDPQDCELIDWTSYSGYGYVHQGWFTKDFSHFLLDDELDENGTFGTRTRIFSVADLDNIQYLGAFEAISKSIDHNLYVKDQFAFESNYTSGLRILDAIYLSDAEPMEEVGFFDLYPSDDARQFRGTWSNYPYLPSGINLATSMYQGLFITYPNLLELIEDDLETCGVDEVTLSVKITADLDFPLVPVIAGIPGNLVVTSAPIETPGTYSILLSGLLEVPEGEFPAKLQLTNTSGQSYDLSFHLSNAPFQVQEPFPLSPASESVFVLPESVQFEWSSQPNAVSYIFQLSVDGEFNSLIVGDTITETTFTWEESLPDGEYFWRVRANGYCGDSLWSDTLSFLVVLVSVDENNLNGSDQLMLSPNPAEDIVTLNWTGIGLTLIITDSQGRSIAKHTLNRSGRFDLDLSGFARGLYYLQLDNRRATLVKN